MSSSPVSTPYSQTSSCFYPMGAPNLCITVSWDRPISSSKYSARPAARFTGSASAALFARGVRQYWIIDPNAASIEIINADGEIAYLVTDFAEHNLTLRLSLLGDLAADPTTLFPADTKTEAHLRQPVPYLFPVQSVPPLLLSP